MFIAILTIHFHLQGCTSLKEKRGRIRGLRDKFGRSPSVAVCESHWQNQHHEAEYTFTVVGLDKKMIHRQMEAISQHCELNLDAVIVDHRIDWL